MEPAIESPVRATTPTAIHPPATGGVVRIGYVLLAFSFMIFATLEYWGNERETFAMFVVHYVLACLYAGWLIFDKSFGIRRSFRRANLHKTVVMMNLFLISAYALNREIPVFEDSADWLCVYLVVSSLTLLSYRYANALPSWGNRLQHILLGSAMVLYLYMALFVAEVYIWGGIGMIVFGIGGHIFVPLMLLTLCGAILYHERRASYRWAIAGVVLTAAYAVGFIVEWDRRVTEIERLANQSVLYKEANLPAWVKVAESLPPDWISRRILKYELVYTVPSDAWDFGFRNTTLDEPRKHDPFVYLASLRSKCTLPAEDRVRILHAISDSRHFAEERLWSGDNLTTSYIVSDIDIYPDLRLAYTEKYLHVRNTVLKKNWWGNTEEAIYTFQLPEGSVVTSLSLWINGKEEKGILTSRQKATEAYKTIVGVEQRDPSVIHWQEGNTVTVRVFPCTPAEERQFKIGVTSPLKEKDGRIVYDNITFKGPNPTGAKETTRLRFVGSPAPASLPDSFRKDEQGDYISEQAYRQEFAIDFPALPLRGNQFWFDGHTYSLKAHQPQYAALDVTKLYLDINNSWTADELQALKALSESIPTYAYGEQGFVSVQGESWVLVEKLRKRNFSLLPFHKLPDAAHALVITKGKKLSPHLADFKDSGFADGMRGFFAAGHAVNVFNLAGGTATLISSLRELRGLNFAEGSTDDLKALLQEKKFPRSEESDERVVLHDAAMVITRTPSPAVAGNAPDHLARLFAYNNIMRQVGPQYFNNDFINDALVQEARKAYVVSPVSSLIVLETQQDYDRFGIHDAGNSLGNAAKDSSGGVPEPHEWALIAVFLLLMLYVRFRHANSAVS